MGVTELAHKMLEWHEAQARADLLKMDIEAAVLQIGKTQTVGNVRATYSAGRKSYDYEAAALGVSVALAEAVHQAIMVYQVTKTDWKAVCEAARVTDIPFTQSPPSVTLKIIA